MIDEFQKSCPSCGVLIRTSSLYCPSCQARVSRYENYTCPTCKGTGKVKCLVCLGTGQVKNSLCLECGGTGVMHCKTCYGVARVGNIEIEVHGTDAKDVKMVAKALLEKSLKEKPSESKKVEVHLHNSIIGILNTGEIEDVNNISVNVSTLAEKGCLEVAEAIKNMTEATAANQGISPQMRTELLEQLEELSRQATLPPGKRMKTGVMKGIWTNLAVGFGAAGGLAEVWSAWGPAIAKFFGF